MNNEHKGEVSFEVGGEPYVLRRSWNSICELEGLTGRGFYSLAVELQSWTPPTDAKGKLKKETPEQLEARTARISGSTLRAVFCSMLRDERPALSLREAGDLIDALGIEKVLELVMHAFARGNPPDTTRGNGAAEAADTRPTIAAVGST